jgi:hypothetical protein
MDHIEALERERGERRMNASEAARALGYDDRYFHGKRPIRYPQFTLGLYPLRDWKAWNLGKTEAERQAEWDEMPLKERKRRLGIHV